jgi:hypothetical protein
MLGKYLKHLEKGYIGYRGRKKRKNPEESINVPRGKLFSGDT